VCGALTCAEPCCWQGERPSLATSTPPAGICCTARVSLYCYAVTNPATSGIPARVCSLAGSTHARHPGAPAIIASLHPSDMAVAMRALDAKVEPLNHEARSPGPFHSAEFHRIPAQHAEIETRQVPEKSSRQ